MKDKFAQFNSLQAKLESVAKTWKRPSVCVKKSLNNTAHWARIKEMAAKYGYDISGPATTAQEAIQWTYFGYLAAVNLRTARQCPSVVTSSFHGYLHRA